MSLKPDQWTVCDHVGWVDIDIEQDEFLYLCALNTSSCKLVWYKTKFGRQNLATKFGNHLCIATKIGRQSYFLVPPLG